MNTFYAIHKHILFIHMLLVSNINKFVVMLDMFFSSNDTMGRIRVLSIKVALATMCSGKLMDKLRCKLINYIFKYL